MSTRSIPLTAALVLALGAPLAVQAQPGELDLTFNNTGYVIDPVDQLDVCYKILVQPDQKVLNVGMSFNASYVSTATVFRYLPDGTRDTEFADNGLFTYGLDFEANLYGAVLTPEGKIVLAGSTTDYQTYRILLIQLNPDGTLDSGFGNGGVVVQSVSVVAANAEDISYDVTLDANGNILVCGSTFDTEYIRRPMVVRFTPDGTLDTTFGVDGVASIPSGAGESNFKAIAVQPDGKILASGKYGNDLLWWVLLLVRFEADGSLDASFGDGGIVQYDYASVDDRGDDLVLMPDGSILVAGLTATASYNFSALLMKFTSTGELDPAFSDDGIVMEDMAIYDYAAEVALLDDGRIVMAGTSGLGPPNTFDLAVWKYNADGTRDNTFGDNGVIQHDIGDYSTMIYGMDVQADGKILIGGQARTSVNQNYFFTGRLQNEIISGVPDMAAATETQVFPNPAVRNNRVTLNVGASVLPGAQLALLTADGRRVATFNADGLLRTPQGISIQLPGTLAPGVYHLDFQQAGTRLSARILVTP